MASTLLPAASTIALSLLLVTRRISFPQAGPCSAGWLRGLTSLPQLESLELDGTQSVTSATLRDWCLPRCAALTPGSTMCVGKHEHLETCLIPALPENHNNYLREAPVLNWREEKVT